MRGMRMHVAVGVLMVAGLVVGGLGEGGAETHPVSSFSMDGALSATAGGFSVRAIPLSRVPEAMTPEEIEHLDLWKVEVLAETWESVTPRTYFVRMEAAPSDLYPTGFRWRLLAAPGSDVSYAEMITEGDAEATRTDSNCIAIRFTEDCVVLDERRFQYLDTRVSSFLRGAWYDPDEEYLIIRIRNTHYHYCGVEEHVWERFINCASFGTCYNDLFARKVEHSCLFNPTPTYDEPLPPKGWLTVSSTGMELVLRWEEIRTSISIPWALFD